MDYLSPQAHIDEEKFSELLIKPLERFLCGAKSLKGSDDPALVLVIFVLLIKKTFVDCSIIHNFNLC